jgi:serine/threonine protein kinase
MKPVEFVGGYELTTPWSTAGGGQSQWAFARRAGTEYFLKQFLSPTYPQPGSPGSEKIKQAKLQRCDSFESHHKAVAARLKPISGEGSNLVVTKDFFRFGSHYYKVTEKIDVSGLVPADIVGMDQVTRLLVMLTAAHSIETLHVAGLVHGDIKPENVLIKQDGSNFAAKIIDFDNCFIAGEPPPPQELVGDPAYYSPELMNYVKEGAGGEQLSAKNDVFALGLVFWHYVKGMGPALPADQKYAGEAIAVGWKSPMHSSAARSRVSALIASMLSLDPAERPGMKEIHVALKNIRRVGDPVVTEAPTRRGLVGRLRDARDSLKAEIGADIPVSRGLVGKMRSRESPPPAEPVIDAADTAADTTAETPVTGGRLKGTLKGKADADAKKEAAKEGQLRGSLTKKKR